MFLKNKKIGAYLWGLIILVMGVIILFPNGLLAQAIPIRFYNVLTNSMEPTIETNSIVCVMIYHDKMKIEPGDIITFKARRFNEEVIITHRFAYAESAENNVLIYRTHPDQSDIIDVYDTKREDILGRYLFHIPKLGKFALFVRSKFGFIWFMQVITILLIQETILAFWEKKRKMDNYQQS